APMVRRARAHAATRGERNRPVLSVSPRAHRSSGARAASIAVFRTTPRRDKGSRRARVALGLGLSSATGLPHLVFEARVARRQWWPAAQNQQAAARVAARRRRDRHALARQAPARERIFGSGGGAASVVHCR